MKHRTTIVSVFVIIVGVLGISVVFLGGSENPNPTAVNTSADADELVSESFKRLESSDYELIVTYHEKHSGTSRIEYYAVSNSDRRAIVGLPVDKDVLSKYDRETISEAPVDDELLPIYYYNDGALWTGDGQGGWELYRQHTWPSNGSKRLPDPEAFCGASASAIERTDQVIVVEISETETLNLNDSVFRPKASQWTLTIDANSGNLRHINTTHEFSKSNLTKKEYEFEYGITVERPDGIPFSVEEYYYRFLVMDLYEQLGLIGGPLLILVGCVVLYREYPLHRKLR